MKAATLLTVAGGGRPYFQRQKASNPAAIAYWPFGELTGTVAASVMDLSGNLVYNPGFEYAGAGGADLFANWTETAGTSTLADETTVVRSGGHAFKITSGSTSNGFAGATLRVKPGRTYAFTLWTQGDGTHPTRILIYDLTGSAIITNLTSTGVTGAAYAAYSGTFTTPANCVSVSFRLYGPTGDTYFGYFDDITITATAADGAFDGTYVACTLAQPGDKGLSITLDGSTSYVNLLSAPLVNAFNPLEFGISLRCRVSAAADWTDGASHVLFRLTTDANNYILIYKPNTPNGKIYCQYTAGGTSVAATISTTSTDWMEVKMSVSKSADELKAYLNGVQQDTTKTGLGTWITTALPTVIIAGASTTTPTTPWKGGIAHLMVTSPFDYPAGRMRIPIDAADVDSNGNIFAGRGSTIYKSTDGGDTWAAVYTVPGGVGIIGRVYCDSRDYVYVSGRNGTSDYGLYRSVDGGANWTQVLVTTEGTVWGIDEDAEGDLYCGLHGFGEGTLQTIWKSTNDGASWSVVFQADYGSEMQNHIHDIRVHPATGYIYATIGDQVNNRMIRSVDAGANWTVVYTGGLVQLLAMAVLGEHVYIGTDSGSGNKIMRFTDDGSATVTLEDMYVMPDAEDVAIFAAGETANKIFMLGYKESKTKECKLYVYDGSTWTTPYSVGSGEANRGYYTVSRHDRSGVYYVSNDYGSVAGYGIKLTP